ncbi:Hypothetical protein CINCED_3A021894 [Cinara cedri]|uniref:Toxin CdiA n=1 Tax=Cinara cedri TaxID=506608 RepID=A0A5E4N246_9HEMI|nr:Hypothetical protein CINCED_3A021894 [Cinara cedri]
MSLNLCIIFIMHINVIIYQLPKSYGRVIEGYSITTLEKILTPAERENYLETGILPSRLTTESYASGVTIGGLPGTNVRRQRRKNTRNGGYRVIPRWRYFMEKLLSNFGTIPELNTITSLLGNRKGADAQRKRFEDDQVADNAKDSTRADGTAYQTILNAANSDLGQQAIKTGVGFLPAGGALVKAYEHGSKINEAITGAVSLASQKKSEGDKKNTGSTYQNLKDLATSEAGTAAIKMGVGLLPGGGPAVQAYENGTKLQSVLTQIGGLGKKSKQ